MADVKQVLRRVLEASSLIEVGDLKPAQRKFVDDHKLDPKEIFDGIHGVIVVVNSKESNNTIHDLMGDKACRWIDLEVTGTIRFDKDIIHMIDNPSLKVNKVRSIGIE